MNYRGFYIDDKVKLNEKGQKYMWIGMYKVVQSKDRFVGVYNTDGILLTHTDKWKKATKIAKLMLNSYCEGYEHGLDINNYY